MKKLFVIILIISALVVITGCNLRRHYPEFESGYYKYAVKTEKDGTKKAYILELTDLGKEQTVLIYPEEIDGITVYGIGYSLTRSVWNTEHIGNLESSNLEKIYFLKPQIEDIHRGETVNLDNTYAVYWNLDYDFYSLVNSAGLIYGYNYYSSSSVEKPYQYDSPNKIANVSYMYNYENSDNEGYFWVDSYNESLITNKPPTPQREGYRFEGWYKEEECINEWNFESDITDKEIIISDDVHDSYEGIYLYAKWSKIVKT